jgi:hypothetical protein
MVFEQFLSIGGIIATLVSAIVAFIAIIIADELIAHNIEIKHSLIMAIVAMFIVPIISLFALSYVNLDIPYIGTFIIPLIIWIILGEILLKADFMAKLKVIVIAFIVFEILEMFLVPYLFALMPTF